MHLPDPHIPASACLDALRAAGCDHVVTVPDWVQLAMHVRLEAGESGLKLVSCCAEDQAVTAAAGLTVGGKRPVVVVQNQGGQTGVALAAVAETMSVVVLLALGSRARRAAAIREFRCSAVESADSIALTITACTVVPWLCATDWMRCLVSSGSLTDRVGMAVTSGRFNRS